eukprot:6580436-Prymnesium_polylepis.1
MERSVRPVAARKTPSRMSVRPHGPKKERSGAARPWCTSPARPLARPAGVPGELPPLRHQMSSRPSVRAPAVPTNPTPGRLSCRRSRRVKSAAGMSKATSSCTSSTTSSSAGCSRSTPCS